MKCPRDSDILDMIAGRLDSERQQRLREHAATCPICREAVESIGASWGRLGAWSLGPTMIDVVDHVVERADSIEQQRPPTRIELWRRPLRIAASIVLSAGLGIAAGTLVPVQTTTSSPPSDEQVAESLGLTSLADESSTGLLGALEVPLAASSEEGGAP